ncbi:16 kDa phloem protein 2 [Medicago truncatula]|uniref:Elicitor-responsive-like protein n=1 Tax=Medicago truncatula TaxID=3880 RepID=G7I541_MEDTR|nr:16 kDa phloem protein 2 [Medicago truncatula]AES58842.2 elicitor-responsive-like protein [Medicago truncatula]
MPRGTLEVVLIGAKDLHDSDLFEKMDPYVILSYRSQEHKSSVAKNAGSNPRWNESFLFTVSDNAAELNLRLMDEDTFTKDDLLGEVKIHLGPVLEYGSIPETAYNVVKQQNYCGEVHVALTFHPEGGRY